MEKLFILKPFEVATSQLSGDHPTFSVTISTLNT